MSDLAYDAMRTALLVVDPDNDFISEGGTLYELSRGAITSQDPGFPARAGRARRRGGALRPAGLAAAVVHVPVGHRRMTKLGVGQVGVGEISAM